MGAGNHLLIREDVYADFKGMTADAIYPEDLYEAWMAAAMRILDDRNAEKNKATRKSVEEALLEANALMRMPVEEQTEEERIEEEMEAGYDPFEDERIYVTSELVHGDEVPESLRVREGFFSDGRSYLSEMWCYEQTTNVTYYFPVEDPLVGMLKQDEKILEEYLIKENKLFEGEEHPMEIMVLETAAGKIYSVNVCVGCDDDLFCRADM